MGLMPVQAAETKKVDVLLVGGGIMSATLAVWLNELEPSWSMEMVERLDGVAEESSNGWNNAGTG
ncbi:malate:quinone oxidoreductase, partial [Pseudomonas savastanoi]